MIEKDKFHILNYVKREEYTGSMNGMRYMLKKKETEGEARLEVIIWPEPFNYSKTPEAKKQRQELSFDEDGVMTAADWLNEQYESQKQLWELSLARK